MAAVPGLPEPERDPMALGIVNKFLDQVYCTCANCPTRVRVLGKLKMMRKQKQPHCDIIDFIFDFLSTIKLIPETKDLEEAKCDAKSEEYRNLGNEHFVAHSYVDALREYNKSICFAVSGENVSTAMSNRSAVLMKMQMYPECLESIRLAREVGLPEKLVEKLAHREEMCRAKIRDNPPEEVLIPTIDLPVNEKIPNIAKCLRLHENKKFGRHIVTEEEIPAGKIIALDQPYCQVVINSHKYVRCTTCLLQVPHLLIPCDTCTQAMFCSVVCKEKALKDFHAMECSMSGALLKMFGCEYLIASRMVVRVFLSFPDVETMNVAMKKMEKAKKTIFNFDWSKELSPEEKYTPIHTLCTEEENKKEHHLLQMYVMACLMFNIFMNGSQNFRQRYLLTREDENTLKNIIFRHILIAFHNGNRLSSMSVVTSTSGKEDEYGYKISGLNSLINHSCCSNARCFAVGTSYGIVTIKKIPAGAQVFNSLGCFYTSKNLKDRQDELHNVYSFHCKCLACIRNYPMYDDLPSPEDVPPFEVDIMRNISLTTQKGIFDKVVQYIRKYGHYYPTKQLVDAELEFISSFRTMYKDYSLHWHELMTTKCRTNSRLHIYIPRFGAWIYTRELPALPNSLTVTLDRRLKTDVRLNPHARMQLMSKHDRINLRSKLNELLLLFTKLLDVRNNLPV